MKDHFEETADLGVVQFTPNAAFAITAQPRNRTSRPSKATAQPRPYRTFFKRLADVSLVLASLPFSLPVIGTCALALWIEGGNPFYTQTRRGKDGKSFRLLKLRTMVRDADAELARLLKTDPALRAEWDALQKLRDDPRITRVGRLLRKTSLDELPQILNVLRGEMSLVGPRPMMTQQSDMYGNLTHYDAVRPGITGLWQVSARNEERFDYRQKVDREYEQTLSLKTDLKILFKTIGVVLRRTGH